jgi:outer membrane protein
MTRHAMTIAIGACLSALACAPVAAQTSNSVRLGIYVVQYHVSADDLSGPFIPAGTNLNIDVKNVNTVYFAYLRRLSEHFDLEFAGGWPPKTDTVGKGPAAVGSVPYNGQVIATSKWFAPTVLIEYKLFDDSSAWRPFAGLGINYTHFYDRTSTAAGNAAAGGPTTISLSDSIGPAATVGVTYRVQSNWTVQGSYSRSKVRSDEEANTAGVVRKTTINFNPAAWVLSVGYNF